MTAFPDFFEIILFYFFNKICQFFLQGGKIAKVPMNPRLTNSSQGVKNIFKKHGRLAQVDRALVSGTKGRGFESRIAHQ
jgi:hypothetical protein